MDIEFEHLPGGHIASVAPSSAALVLARASTGRGWRRAAFILVLAVTLSQILLFGGVYAWSWIPAGLCLVLGATVILLAGVWFHRVASPWHPIFAPVLLFGGLVALQWAAKLSLNPALTLTGLLQLAAGGAVLYLGFLAFGSDTNLRLLSVALWIFSGGIAAEALAQFFEAGGKIFWFHNAAYATPIGPFVYHNHYAGMVDLLLPVSLAAAFRPLGRRRPDALGLVRRCIFPALLLASLMVSYSRGGFFTLLFECVLGVIVYRHDLRAATIQWWKPTLVVLALLGFAALANWGPMIRRLGKLESHNVSATQRLAFAQAGLAMWRDHPIAGTGFNTFASVYPAYQRIDIGLQVLEAHNDYVQALAGTGLVGAVLVLAFLVILLHSRWQQFLTCSHSPRDVYRRACFIGVCGFLFHASGDFLFRAPGDMLLFFLLVGVCLAAGSPSRPTTRPAGSPPIPTAAPGA